MTSARWVNRNRDWLLPFIAIILMLVVVFGMRGIVNQQHQSSLDFCERSNAARVASIHSLRGDVHSLKAELALWEAASSATTPAARAATPPEVTEAFRKDIAAIRLAIHRKGGAVALSIAAQAPVAIHPGSPIVDCAKAYP